MRQFIEIMSGADTLPMLESDIMETEQETVDNHGSDDNDNTAVTNGNTANGNVDTDHNSDMEIETSHRDQNSITSNPAKLGSFIK